MKLTSGKHAGKTTEHLVIKEPDYVEWSLGNHPYVALKADLAALIKKFDAKPFVAQCAHPHCSSVATRASVYQNNPSPFFWCSACDPYSYGAVAGKLTLLTTYKQALTHVGFWSSGNKGDKRIIIKALADAKGAPARLTQPALEKFFA